MTGEEICRKLDALAAQGAGIERLLASAVEYLHASSGRFHWTGIYELFPDNVLRLGPFIGAATDHVFIAVGRGVCGTAVAERRNINVPDVSKVANYLACSTTTRSELVVLIRKGERIFGQIDIDSHELDAFDGETAAMVEKVAERLAEAYAGDGRAASRTAPDTSAE
jgi:L-methionine (R)-S-oxide reductase